MNKTQVTPNGVLEGMIRKRSGHIICCKDRLDQFAVEKEAMAAALLWLADNVSDEMVGAYLQCKPTNPRNIHNAIRESIAAALRAAAGSATSEVKP